MRVSDLWLPVRWSDGRQVRYRSDATALVLWLAVNAATIAGLAGVWLLDMSVFWWVLVAALPLNAAAQLRLRYIVRRAERQGVVPPVPSQTRRETLRSRFAMWAAGRCDLKEAKLLARADAARTTGAADRYRRRAERERDWAQKCRDQAAANMNPPRPA